MFPNDDICNLRAAKSAARRIFEKYSITSSSSTSSKGLGQEQVSGLIKNAYSAINMTYDPSTSDVSSFMSVFGVDQNGTIQLDKLEELAVKYLCGEENYKIESNNPQNKSQQKKYENTTVKENSPENKYKKPEILLAQNCQNHLQLKNGQYQSNTKNFNLKFLSPRVTQSTNFFSSKENTVTSSENLSTQEAKIGKKPTFSQILNQANEIFNLHKNKKKNGITIKQIPEVLTKTYRLIGKTRFKPSEEDIKIWMKLCDVKKNGIVEWVSYQNFVKRMMERESIFETN